MQDPGLRYQYAPPYSPQRTDPDYEKNWQRSPKYDPAPDDTLFGPIMLARQLAALGGAPEWRPSSGPVPGGSRVPQDFMYDQKPIPQDRPGPPPMTQPYWSIQGAERLRQARQAEQQANVPQDRAAIMQGMTYGPQQLRGQMNLLPQYQSLGNIRPLGPGEYVQHPDPVTGRPAISSEETITVPYQGKWAVLPSLWLVNGRAMVVDENTAVQYAQASGLNWPMFNSENEGNDWAEQREKQWYQSGGRTDTQPPLWSRPWPPQRQ